MQLFQTRKPRDRYGFLQRIRLQVGFWTIYVVSDPKENYMMVKWWRCLLTYPHQSLAFAPNYSITSGDSSPSGLLTDSSHTLKTMSPLTWAALLHHSGSWNIIFSERPFLITLPNIDPLLLISSTCLPSIFFHRTCHSLESYLFFFSLYFCCWWLIGNSH